jgi:hypothetical protein
MSPSKEIFKFALQMHYLLIVSSYISLTAHAAIRTYATLLHCKCIIHPYKFDYINIRMVSRTLQAQRAQ